MEIYRTIEQEIHHFGSYCAVVWNMRSQPKTVIDRDSGQSFTFYQDVRDGKPYISFMTMRYDKDRDEFYRSDDNPVIGGISADEAKELIKELTLAVVYLESFS